jgi:FAD/FMN-containing dehydrogenase
LEPADSNRKDSMTAHAADRGAGNAMIGFDGSVYRSGDDGYEAARRAAVWNGIKPKRFPAVIVVAGSQDDVPRSVALAREEGLSVGIRSGGHNFVGNAVREGGLLLDLSRLKEIVVDPQARTATIEPGVRVDELVAALSAHGLYFPVGHAPSVGVMGFLLGGGDGFNSANVGPAAYSLRAIDVVTADGEKLHATDDDHADVLWAARGSGPGFFAVATRMHLDLRPMPGIVATAVQVHPLASYDELLPWYLEMIASKPGFWTSMIATKDPLFDQVDPVLTISGYAFADDIDHATQIMAALETAPGLDGAIVHQAATPASMEQVHAQSEMVNPKGLRYLVDNVHIKEPLSQDFWQDAKTVIETLPSARSAAWFVPPIPMADVNAAYSLQTELRFMVTAIYEDSAQDEAMLAWHTDSMARIDRHSIGGGYAGDSTLFVHPMAILSPDSAARLEALRSKYDPDGRFFSYPSELPPARLHPPATG